MESQEELAKLKIAISMGSPHLWWDNQQSATVLTPLSHLMNLKLRTQQPEEPKEMCPKVLPM